MYARRLSVAPAAVMVLIFIVVAAAAAAVVVVVVEWCGCDNASLPYFRRDFFPLCGPDQVRTRFDPQVQSTEVWTLDLKIWVQSALT